MNNEYCMNFIFFQTDRYVSIFHKYDFAETCVEMFYVLVNYA